ncbi:tis1421-transposase b [Xanthomonas fragariae LMG 25863]|nr:tis1421-transposase b [Xanthomonas fragariae LMG 25863]
MRSIWRLSGSGGRIGTSRLRQPIVCGAAPTQGSARCRPRSRSPQAARQHFTHQHFTHRSSGIERNDQLVRHRWVVERTYAWFVGFGMRRFRFERRIDLHLAWLSLAYSII